MGMPFCIGDLRSGRYRTGARREQARVLHRTRVFATGVATCVLLIASYDRPFTDQLAITPNPMLQVMPKLQGIVGSLLLSDYATKSIGSGLGLWLSRWDQLGKKYRKTRADLP